VRLPAQRGEPGLPLDPGATGTRRQSDWDYRAMALWFKIRDRLLPRERILAEAGIRPGFQVLDYGCGPGSYIPATVRLAGAGGRVHALDAHPVAARVVDRLIREHGWENVTVIRSHCRTGLPDTSLDVALLYDTFHGLERPADVLAELHRVLKPAGVLSFNDHHLREPEIRTGVTAGGWFELLRKGRYTYTFGKALPALR